MASAHDTAIFSPQRHKVHKEKILESILTILCDLCAFVVINEIGSNSYQVETSAQQIPYGLEFRMQFLHHLLGRRLFFA